ncbi:LysR family transcriptional regulator [Streptomyces similanensis]|uniref:LysR family transcriptional regulator n=3 Tax=Streptomyces TaxID=1883 RepID=A0ABP9KF79_9ACTN
MNIWRAVPEPPYAAPMELEVRHLRVLCAIADTGSLHRAARELGMAQPSLSTQLRRIEQALGGQLFVRARTGCRATPLGHEVLGRARPLVAELAALVTETRAAAARAACGQRLRIGSTASRAIPGWLRRLRARAPRTEPALQMDVSANSLLRMVVSGRLDTAFVHEVEGTPLRVPPGLCLRVLVEREPQFVTLAADHPAAVRREVALGDLAGDRWMVDSTVDGEWDALRRVLRAAGQEPDMLHGDYLTAYSLAAIGEVVTVSQPTAHPRADLALRPLRGDPIGVRLLLAARTEEEVDGVFEELADAYREAAAQSPVYRDWLERSAAGGAAWAADLCGTVAGGWGRGRTADGPLVSVLDGGPLAAGRRGAGR